MAIVTVVSGRARSVWAGPGVVGGDGAIGGVVDEAGRRNHWKAAKEMRTAQASVALNTQAASEEGRQGSAADC